MIIWSSTFERRLVFLPASGNAGQGGVDEIPGNSPRVEHATRTQAHEPIPG
jgi:hypothetical protein